MPVGLAARRRFLRTVALMTPMVNQGITAAAEASRSAPPEGARTLRVGPAREIRTIGEAAARARDGDTVAIDAGQYRADVAVWERDSVTVRAVGGRVAVIASGALAEGKALWVSRSASLAIEGVDFIGARVPDGNGAGIRLERGRLSVRNCAFLHNEMGILTSNHPEVRLDVQACEFGYNGAPDGYSHHLYAGRIRELAVTGSYFHHVKVGHLLKSRAAQSSVLYNRLTDESGGSASYELEFPNGGLAYAVGNIIEQGEKTENPVMVSFGAEGFAHPRNELYMVNNTLIDLRREGGSFLVIRPGNRQVAVINNLLVGQGRLEQSPDASHRFNHRAEAQDFVDPAQADFRLAAGSALIGMADNPGMANGVDLTPRREYVHPLTTRPAVGRLNPGAMQSTASR